jgi:Protein of unknown function (DUF2934)
MAKHSAKQKSDKSPDPGIQVIPSSRRLQDERILDPEAWDRDRMISEAAYERYMQRGYCDGYDVDDWLAAEAEVDEWIYHEGRRRQANE